MKRYSGFKLLAVDDNEHNLFTLRALVQEHMDVEILEARGGAEALEIAQANPDIDLIILDVQMPEVDGFETAQMLKLRKKTRDIPIIFLTAAFKTEEFQRKGYDVGAVDYLLKPIVRERPAEALDRVRRLESSTAGRELADGQRAQVSRRQVTALKKALGVR